MISKITPILVFLLSITLVLSAQDTKPENSTSEQDIKISAVAELGFLGVLGHKIQFGKGSTYFSYKKDGGQDVLFPVSRLSLELDYKKRNTFVLLYQPLRIETQVLLDNDLVVDSLTFPAATSVKLLYNFPFYRLSYLREVLKNNDKFSLAVGGTLQIRNTTISFESADGSGFRTSRNVGIVPAFKIRGKAQFTDRFYTEIEADGMYAPISFLNGSDNEVVGAILDASIRAGLSINDPVDAFLNLRFLSGGAVGTSDNSKGPGDGYVKNWLNFLTVSAGAVYAF